MFSELKQYLEMISEEENIPACDCIVYHGHDVVFRHMVGFSDAEKTKPVSATDKYILYSATKPMTMVAVMQLVEKGLIKLEDEIYHYLPEFEHMYVGDQPAKNKITIEHLMTMSGGFNYNLNGAGIQEVIKQNPNATLAEVMKGLAKQPLDFEPGTHFKYSLCHDDFRNNINMRGYSYGLGVRTMVNKVISGSKSPIGEFGWDGAAGAYVLIDVENKIGIFYAQEIRGKGMAGEVHPRIRNLVYEALGMLLNM